MGQRAPTVPNGEARYYPLPPVPSLPPTSLVIPAIERSGIPFAVVDVPLPDWQPLLDQRHGLVEVTVNDAEVCTLELVTGDDPLPDEISGGRGLLVCTSEEETLVALAQRATTMSTSLGPFLIPTVTNFLDKIAVVEGQEGEASLPIIYCCENDHAEVFMVAPPTPPPTPGPSTSPHQYARTNLSADAHVRSSGSQTGRADQGTSCGRRLHGRSREHAARHQAG